MYEQGNRSGVLPDYFFVIISELSNLCANFAERKVYGIFFSMQFILHLIRAKIACNKKCLRTSTNMHGQVTIGCHWYTTSAKIETRRQILLKVLKCRVGPVRNIKAYRGCRSVSLLIFKLTTG